MTIRIQDSASKSSKPLVAVTMGDPAGIGPEIIAGAWPETIVHEWCRPVVVGHPEILRRAVSLWGLGIEVVEIDSPEQARPSVDAIPCIPCGSDDALGVTPGTIDPRAGQAAYDAVVTAVRLALAGRVAAITTAPLQKEAMHRAGHPYPGHTELLAELCGVQDYAMMLYLGPSEDAPPLHGLAVVHVTLHTALRNVFSQLTEEAILGKARLADQFTRRVAYTPGEAAMRSPQEGRGRTPKKLRRPRIGVCALNPHGGEGGIFGDEEITVIRPAVERGLAEGLNLEGPAAVDTLMVRARNDEFDALVAMYHDQGHIALKLMGMHRAVNVTLGLPIVRTSVAHGTAFDIAWQRQAETGSMIESLHVAAQLARSGEQETSHRTDGR